jgi:hypothetical protein
MEARNPAAKKLADRTDGHWMCDQNYTVSQAGLRRVINAMPANDVVQPSL